MKETEELDYKAMYEALRTKVFQDKTELHKIAREAHSGNMIVFSSREDIARKIKTAAFGLGVWTPIFKKI